MGNCVSSSSAELPDGYPDDSPFPGGEKRNNNTANLHGYVGSVSAGTTGGSSTSSSSSEGSDNRQRRRRRRSNDPHCSEEKDVDCDDFESCGSPCSPLSSSSSSSPVHRQLPPAAERIIVREVYDGNSLRLVNDVHVKLLGIDAPELNGRIEKPYSKEAKSYLEAMCLGDEYCEGEPEVWISYDLSLGEQDNKKDHYGRLLGFVWVRQRQCRPQISERPYGCCRPDNEGRGGFLCVNEGLVAEGLATAYSPNKPVYRGGSQQQQQQRRIPVYNWDRLVSIQKRAREMRRGVWTDFEDQDVLRLSTLLPSASSSALGVNADRKNSDPPLSSYHLLNCNLLCKINHAIECRASEALDGGFHPCKHCLG